MSRNQVDPPTISLRGVEGRVIDSSGVAIPNICIALFTEKEYRFVAQTVADENGYFRFGKIPKGSYRLVARVDYDYLCPVNVRIRRVSFPSGGFFRKTHLVLHMRPAAIDVCSYGDTR
ncbi:MAG TPA: carboxypeptidase-like regulatory domain-containing protein [Pyrinomonadaceae bacterium]